MDWSAPVMYRTVRRVMSLTAVMAAVMIVFSTSAASATWSVIAVDPETGRVGAVMASCVDAGILGESDKPLIPIVVVPGFGVGAVQGTFNWDAPDEIRRSLQRGVSAADLVESLTSDTFETDPEQDSGIRQYGVVAIDQGATSGDPIEVVDLSAVFSGETIENEKQAVAGKNVAAQGLLLADKAVVNDAVSAYAIAVDNSEPMEQALVDALVAGSQAGGDRRCGDQTALFAQLVVADPDDDPLAPSTLLTVTVDEGDGQNPVLLLSDAFDQGQSGWVDAGQRSSVGISKLWASVATGILAAAGFLLLRKGMGNPAARR